MEDETDRRARVKAPSFTQTVPYLCIAMPSCSGLRDLVTRVEGSVVPG